MLLIWIGQAPIIWLLKWLLIEIRGKLYLFRRLSKICLHNVYWFVLNFISWLECAPKWGIWDYFYDVNIELWLLSKVGDSCLAKGPMDIGESTCFGIGIASSTTCP